MSATTQYVTARTLKSGDIILSTYNVPHKVESVSVMGGGKLQLNLRGNYMPWYPIVEEGCMVVKRVETAT